MSLHIQKKKTTHLACRGGQRWPVYFSILCCLLCFPYVHLILFIFLVHFFFLLFSGQFSLDGLRNMTKWHGEPRDTHFFYLQVLRRWEKTFITRMCWERNLYSWQAELYLWLHFLSISHFYWLWLLHFPSCPTPMPSFHICHISTDCDSTSS